VSDRLVPDADQRYPLECIDSRLAIWPSHEVELRLSDFGSRLSLLGKLVGHRLSYASAVPVMVALAFRSAVFSAQPNAYPLSD
jgi:hypothetical protein